MTITQIVDDLRAKNDMHQKAIKMMEDEFAAAVGMIHGEARCRVQCSENSYSYSLAIRSFSKLPEIIVRLPKKSINHHDEPNLVDLWIGYKDTTGGTNILFTSIEQAIERVKELLYVFRKEDEKVVVKKPAEQQDNSGSPPQAFRVEYSIYPTQTISGTP